MQTTKPVDKTDLADAISTGVSNASVTDQHGAGLDVSQRSEIADTIRAEFEARGFLVIEGVEWRDECYREGEWGGCALGERCENPKRRTLLIVDEVAS